MNERKLLLTIMRVVNEELHFLTKGYRKEDRPAKVQQEIDDLNQVLRYVESKLSQMNEKEYAQ